MILIPNPTGYGSRYRWKGMFTVAYFIIYQHERVLYVGAGEVQPAAAAQVGRLSPASRDGQELRRLCQVSVTPTTTVRTSHVPQAGLQGDETRVENFSTGIICCSSIRQLSSYKYSIQRLDEWILKTSGSLKKHTKVSWGLVCRAIILKSQKWSVKTRKIHVFY